MTYDFASLEPADFENLARDLVGFELGLRFEAFATGPDGGMDGRHVRADGAIILQAKHFRRSGSAALKTQMSKERAAIDRLQPARYVLVTSAPLSPKSKADLAKIIGPALLDTGDILGPDDLNALLRKFPDVAKAHERLWAPTSTVLETVVVGAVERGLTKRDAERTQRDSALSAKLDGLRGGIDRMVSVLAPDLEIVGGYRTLSAAQISRLPTAMVIADYGVTPYDDNRGLCRDLLAWAEDGSATSPGGRIYVGRGGAGKTRLALEAISRLRERGWHAGLVSREALDRLDIHGRSDAQARLARFFGGRGRKGAFVVMDYAEGRQAQIDAVVRSAHAAAPGSPIRIVLLARTAGEWWSDYLDGNRDAELTFEEVPFSDAERELNLTQRRSLFDAAAQVFAARLARSHGAGEILADSAWQTRPVPTERLNSAAASTILAVLFEAFLHVRGVTATLDPVREMVREERRHWARALKLDAVRSSREDPQVRLVAHGVAALTMMQGVASPTAAAVDSALDQLVTLSASVVQLPGSSDAARAHAFRAASTAIERLYRRPGADGDGLRPVQPDILGEAVVGDILSESPSLLAALLREAPAAAYDAFVVLNRMLGAPSRDAGPYDEGATAALHDALSGRLGAVADPLMRAATEVVGRMQDTVREVLAQYPLALKQAAATALINAAGSSVDHLATPPARLRLLLGDAALLAGAVPEAAEAPGSQNHLRRIGYAIVTEQNRGAFLEASGTLDEAVNSAGAALSLARKLFSVDEALWAPVIANGENNYARALRVAGRSAEAYAHAVKSLQVCEQYGDQSGAWRDQRRSSLGGFASCAAAHGKYAEAYAASVQVLQSYQPVPAEWQDLDHAQLNALALAFGNHAVRAAETNRHGEAVTASRQAIYFRRELARRDPDTFLSELAASLANFSGMLGSHGGDPTEALEAVLESIALWEAVLPKSPAFRDGLASAIAIAARACLELERNAEALEFEVRCLEVVRALHAEHPRRYAADLAEIAFDHGHTLVTLGEHEQALPFMTESVTLRRALASENWELFAPKLAKSLNNLSGILLGLDRAHEGIAFAREAVDVRAALLPEDGKFGADYGRSLCMLGDILKAAHHASEALSAYEQAAFALRPIVGLDPSIDRLFDVNLNDLCRMLRALDRAEEIDGYCTRLSVPSPEAQARDDVDFFFDSFEAAGERHLEDEDQEDDGDDEEAQGRPARDLPTTTEADLPATDDGGRILRLISGRVDADKDLWCIVAVRPLMFRAYTASLRLGLVNPQDFDEFGEILAQGEGVDPPDDVLAPIAEKFGVSSETLMEHLTIKFVP